jgi:hypothetical protein
MRPIRAVTLTRFVGACAFLLAGVLSAFAHHSVTGVFDVTKEVTVTGKISKLEWVNPHSYVSMDVQEPNGTVTTYSLETLPPAHMRRNGINKEALMGGKDVGQVVTVQFNPAKADPHGGWIIRITYADKHFYQLYEAPKQ